MASIKKVVKKSAPAKKADKAVKAEKAAKAGKLESIRSRFPVRKLFQGRRVTMKASSEIVRSRFAYIILAFVAGFLGMHNFYAGRKKAALAQLAISVSIIVIVLLTMVRFYTQAAGGFRSMEEFIWVSRLVANFLTENTPQREALIQQLRPGLLAAGLASLALGIWIAVDMFMVKKDTNGRNMASWGKEPKSRMAYIALAIFVPASLVMFFPFGLPGVHNFYAMRLRPAFAQLFVTVLAYVFFMPLIVPVYIWVLCEIVMVNRDAKGNDLT
ncbi:MAG: TM2 domain-containing protein [Alphaproteobacteria bacterium]|nr:TM2 domain-containing protein [Alphaproteobacteria bacterium]